MKTQPLFLVLIALIPTSCFGFVASSRHSNMLQSLLTTKKSNNNNKILSVQDTTVNKITTSSLYISPVEAWDAYNAALNSEPLLVKSITAGVILGAADFAGQALENSKKDVIDKAEVDFARAARFAFFGLVLQAPWNHFYYLLLDGQIPPTEDPFSVTNIVKVVIDQFIQAPIFTVLIFVFLGVLEGKALESIQKQLENDYKDTIVANWKLWVPATIINIGFVPPILRVLYLNFVFFFWSIYLSLVVNKKDQQEISST